jgi:arylsulfatase A-like enzyme
VVLIGVDTLRADRLGFHDYDRGVSPNLDALARDSLVFRRAIAPAPWTTPSFASVFTGFHPMVLGIAQKPLPLPAEAVTLTQVLCKAGYQTAGVVSHMYVGFRHGFDRGFEDWDESNACGHAYVSSEEVTDRAYQFLDRFAEEERPFFLFVHYFDPHYDYTEHAEFPFSEGYTGDIRSEANNIHDLRVMARAGALDEEALRYLRDSYDSEIAFTDHHIGRLLQRLKQKGLYEDAVIVFLGDHGEMFATRSERWIGHTHYLYDSLVHVPLLVKLPHQARVGPVEPPVTTVDVPATILDVLELPHSLPGESLLRLTEATARPVFTQTRRGAEKDAVAEGRWKLIRDRVAGSSQLFDVVEDPGELRDVAQEHPEVAARLEQLLDQWLAELEVQSGGFTKAAPLEFTEAEKQRLRDLGYVH